MKKSYYIQVLFLVNYVSIIFGMQPLSPSCLAENREDIILQAINRLSPLNGQTMQEAYIFFTETYSRGSYKRVYITQEEEENELKKIEEAYEVLRYYGFKNYTRNGVQRTLKEELDVYNLPSNSFVDQRSPVQTQSDIHLFEEIIFKNKDDALQCLGYKASCNVGIETLEERIALLELDNEIGVFSDEDFLKAKKAFEYLQNFLK